MNKSRLFAISTMMLVLVGCAVTTWRADEVKNRLAQTSELGAHQVLIDEPNRGVIILEGTVATDQDRSEIERVARQTRGVREVRNNLLIAASSVFVREQDAPPASVTAATIGEILAKVSASPDIQNYDLSVELAGETAILRGQVANESERAAAERLALNTRGVTRVRNEITLMRPSTSRRDLQLNREVRQALLRNRYIDLSNVSIASENGVVTFRGTQNSRQDIDRLMAVARTVAGVRVVRSELAVVAAR